MNGCRRITWRASLWRSSTRLDLSELGPAVRGPRLATRTTRRCCWACWSMATPLACTPAARSSAPTYDSVAFRFIAANTHPDHDTHRHVPAALPAADRGAVRAGAGAGARDEVAQAGQHRAGRHQDRAPTRASTGRCRWAHANKIEAQLRQEVQTAARRWPRRATARRRTDGMDVPAEIARREDRLAPSRKPRPRSKSARASATHVEQQEYEAK